MDKKEIIYVIIINILWYEFQNDFDARTDFAKKNCHKKATLILNSYPERALFECVKYKPLSRLGLNIGPKKIL